MTTSSLILASAISQFPASASAQTSSPPLVGTDSVTIVPGIDYKAGALHQKLLGRNYRDIWTTPIKVPVLDLQHFAGGLTPVKLGGGQQTKSVRFVAPDSSEWVFRSVHKGSRVLGERFDNTIVSYIFHDYGSASHPFGNIPAAVLLTDAGALHPTPQIAVMPDDPALGKFRKEFAGMLGTIEEYPKDSKNGKSFADAKDIIDSDKLLEKMNEDPTTRVDARALLTVRLVDYLLGDNDRHPGQWKWARFGKKDEAVWFPIGRDRDKVFVSYDGMLASVARYGLPNLITFQGTYPSPTAIFANAIEFDRRMLGGLDKSVWDSVALSLTSKLTDAEIARAIAALPPKDAALSRGIADKLRERRNNLRGAADKYYALLSSVVDVHGTDANDDARIVRNGDGSVDVNLSSAKSGTYYSRRFLPTETKEIRVYLHDGNDSAIVSGNVQKSIHLRVIGGNGTNTLVEHSVVGSDMHPTHFVDQGTVSGVSYAVDSVAEKANPDDALNHRFNRRPWLAAYDTLIPPQQDYGVSVKPSAKINTGRGLGYVPRIGVSRFTYGFRDVPYSSLVKADFGYSTKHRGVITNLFVDKRYESTQVHTPVSAQFTQIEIVEFKGFGNNIPDSEDPFYDVRQAQTTFRPAVGFSPNPLSDISLGPIVRYSKTNTNPFHFIGQSSPTGTGTFGEAGLQLRSHYETRYKPDTLKPRALFDLNGSAYPSAWDVKSAYESVDGQVVTFFTVPVKKLPVVALRAGGKKLYGDFPYFDAAFLGGTQNLRVEERQRFAGDASVYGNAELRIPVAQFPFILPLDVGLIGFTDAGRVYYKGESPGGWHTAAGGGLWIGFLNPGTNLNILFTNKSYRRITTSIGFAY